MDGNNQKIKNYLYVKYSYNMKVRDDGSPTLFYAPYV